MDSQSTLPEDEPFEFETEHTVLRNNSDYCGLIKYLVLLENMRVKAIKDIEELSLIQNKALEDPESFIEGLRNQETNLPSRQVIPDFPQIELSKYGIEELQNETKRESTSVEMDCDGQMLVRGRVFTESKPETFNQLWSCEEQRRLEELLEEYPEEAVESHRYKKIAVALGTRTHTQVYSRVQKYFLKLAKLGLPVPGRAPKKKLLNSKDRTKNFMPFYKKSTFFPELHVPVKMDDSIAYEVHPHEATESDSSTVELLRQAKEQRVLDRTHPVWQVGVLCVGCRSTEFVGARWTDHAGTDYCTDCVVQLQPLEKLTPVRDTF